MRPLLHFFVNSLTVFAVTATDAAQPRQPEWIQAVVSPPQVEGGDARVLKSFSIATYGRGVPYAWMIRATGSPVSVDALPGGTKRAIDRFEQTE